MENWQHAGGIIQSEIVYAGDPSPLRLIPSEPGNMVFLAAEVDKARLLRPYISNMLPVYATSQVFAGNANNLVNYDLSEVRFVDMPWLLQPDHPAVMVYPRVTPPWRKTWSACMRSASMPTACCKCSTSTTRSMPYRWMA